MDRDKWLALARTAVNDFGTPFYLFALPAIEDRVAQLEKVIGQVAVGAPVRQFLSVKTLPVPHVLQEWHARGRGVEIVSATELSMALSVGVRGPDIVVNGVGKHHWLPRFDESHLAVNFDSLSEIRALLLQAIRLRWRIGLRLAVSPQVDPDHPEYPAQFGVSGSDVPVALDLIRSKGSEVEVLHFHLHSNMPDTSEYYVALDEWCDLARMLALKPRVVDVGGGIPDPDVRQRGRGGAGPQLMGEYGRFLGHATDRFPELEALWLENGRYVLGPAGILVVSVIDTKWVGNRRFLICDGGRTNQALESDWEEHEVLPLRDIGGVLVPTTICGPNCMAYDWIYRGPLSDEITEGDSIVYLNAGAYHLPWETRFSRGLCRVLWSLNGETVREIRRAEETEAMIRVWRS